MNNAPDEFAVAAHYSGPFDEPALGQWARTVRQDLKAPQVSLGLVFMSPRFFPHAAAVLEILRLNARIPLLIGCSGTSLVAGDQEIESQPGLVLGLYYLPDAEIRACRVTQEQIEEANGPAYWHAETGLNTETCLGWLAFLEPFQTDCERWLRQWNEAFSPLPVYGGLASGKSGEPGAQIYFNGQVFEDGGVVLAVGGKVRLEGVISQGCTPIGETWTITRAEHNIIYQIANRRAYDVLAETFHNLSAEEQRKTQGNLLVGLVVNEYLEEFQRGDFLIRNLMGADPSSGALQIGALPRVGQAIQFQRRDAQTAAADINTLLTRQKARLRGHQVLGGVLCCCNGRGRQLFNVSNHDARRVQEVLGPLGLAGFFCNGEIGPIGDRSFLHGFTAALALFVRD